MELDGGGVAALGSSVVRKEGKSGVSIGGLVRYGGKKGWSRGLGYNVLSLQNGHQLKPATIVGDRQGVPWGAWSPYVRVGAGIGSDKEAGSMNRFVVRTGVGVSRPLHPHWAVGLKTELWYSPAGQTGEDMALMTAGLTLSRSFQTIPRKAVAAKSELKKEDPVAERPPDPDSSPVASVVEGSPPVAVMPVKTAEPSDSVTSHKIAILFRFDRSDAEGSDMTTKTTDLEEAAKVLLNDPDAHAEIHGHADSHGPLGYNIALSRKRATTVRDFFVSQWTLAKTRFTIYAHGAKKPTASNATSHGRAKNRRVLVLLIP
ncbi:MAG: OmpA family protein [Elusimicrobia bacterium]|nr:OmpA family protein [Elusimicrobiota bacterium]